MLTLLSWFWLCWEVLYAGRGAKEKGGMLRKEGKMERKGERAEWYGGVYGIEEKGLSQPIRFTEERE